MLLEHNHPHYNTVARSSKHHTARRTTPSCKTNIMAPKTPLILAFIFTKAILSASFIPVVNRQRNLIPQFASSMDNICPEIPTAPANPFNEIAVLANG